MLKFTLNYVIMNRLHFSEDILMKIIKKIEKSIGKYAIPKLYVYIIAAVILGYIFFYMFPSVYCLLTFNPYKVIIKHQYWRLFTWFFTIPYTLDSYFNMFFLPLNLYFYYFVSESLERTFGKFAFNFYVFSGWFLSTLGMIGVSTVMMVLSDNKDIYRMTYEILGNAGPEAERMLYLDATHYMLLCIFFAFALIYSEMTVLFMFVLPLKVKWSAWLSGAFCIYDFLKGDVYTRTLIVMFVMHFLIYYLIYRSSYGRTVRDIKRQIRYKQGKGTMPRRTAGSSRQGTQNTSSSSEGKNKNVYKFPTKGKAIHKCAVCGRTELDDPTLEFRYCSKCGGDYEYCSDHLYTHEHIINGKNSGN